MALEPDEPRSRVETLDALAREDLELWAVDALEDRIAALEAEIVRARAQIAVKQAGRSAADALFNLRRD